MAELTGHFSKTNLPYPMLDPYLGPHLEIVARGSFERSFRERTPIVNLNHGRDPELGDRPLGEILELREDNVGAFYRVKPLVSIPEMVLDGLRKNLFGASFRFKIEDGGEEWDEYPERTDWNPDRLPVRTFTRLSVSEFGPVTFPASRAATAALVDGGEAPPPQPRSRPTEKASTRTVPLYGLDFKQPRRHPAWYLA